MSYNYYCTGCGRELSQDVVLFNMEPLLVGSARAEDAFRMLQFRLTLAELQSLLQSGQPVDLGFFRCRLGFAALMSCIANPNNLNDPAIASLSMKDIEDYTSLGLFDSNDEAEATTESLDMEGLSLDFITDEGPAEPKEVSPKVNTTSQVSPAILALERKNIKNADIAYIKDNLSHDLSILKNIFAKDGMFEFDIQLKTEMDNEGRPVITGYRVQSGWPRHTTDVDARVCCYCSRPIFQHAGTAQHQAIAFIGDQKAGKTSTILALSHYLENGLLANLGNKVWAESKPIHTVATIELLSKSEKFSNELERYGEGIAPPKTDASKREDAYSVTFRVRNKFEDKYYIITLTDLPGELCNAENGTIDTNKVMDEFQVALSCHAYILCFDTVTAREGKATKMATHVCQWADAFQELRHQRESSISSHQPGYAPIMVLYTKCEELEQQDQPEATTIKEGFDLVKKAYMFYREGLRIDANPIYAFVGEQLKQYASLKESYQARLRISPFGYPAQAINDLNFDLQKVRIPTPKQIDQLMRWVLELSGCVPTEAAYQPNLQTNQLIKPERNFIRRSQYRHQSPGAGGDSEQRFNEALARCHLFENPGYFDDGYVRNYKKGVMTKKLLAEEKLFGKKNNEK